jgi:transcriptional regulator with XRE-family HTH domain
MKPSPETFVFTAELGARLRDLRLKAGLTQLELARAMGRGGKNAGNLVSRLERGDERYPSFGLVADVLRGCRAHFCDLSDILDLYTELPTTQQRVFKQALAKVAASVPQKWQSQVTKYDQRIDIPKTAEGTRPRSDAKNASRMCPQSKVKPDLSQRLERARRNAAAARRRVLYGRFLSRAVNETGLKPVMNVTVPLFNHGLELFRILYRTREAKPGRREKLLALSRATFEQASRFAPEAIQKLEDGVRREFARLELAGDLDWLPDLSLDEYEASLLRPGRRQSLRDVQRREFARKIDEWQAARNAAVAKVWQEVQPVLGEASVPQERRAVYRGLVGACCTAALDFEPGSAREKRQLDEYILEPRWMRLGLDTALAQKLAGIMLARFRELAESLPPDPRPRR